MQVSSTVILARMGMILCTAVLLNNAIETLQVRRHPNETSDAVKEFLAMSPAKVSPELIARDIHRIVASRWIGFHVCFVPIWLLLAFLQTSSFLRRKVIALHRWQGRTMLGISILMQSSIVLMLLTGEKSLGDNEFFLEWGRPEKFFTFKSGVVLFTIYWFYTMRQAYRNASYNTIQLHRYWALQFLATGFGPGTMRLFSFAYSRWFFPKSGTVVISEPVQNAIFGYSLWLGFIFNIVLAHFGTRHGTRKEKSSREVTGRNNALKEA